MVVACTQAFFFFCQNNLSFIALMYLSNSAFQLLLNCRIVMVAISTILVLGKPINAVEWVAVVLLTTGAVQYNLSGCDQPGALRVNIVGVLVMLLIAACAAGGNVYTQLVMQKKMDQPLMFQNAQLYAYGVVFNGVNWAMSMGVTENSDAFGELGIKPILAMVFYALYGLCISVILKRFGAMVRTFVNALAIVCNGLLDASFFGSPVTLSDVTCFSVILCATFLYGNLAADYKPADVAKLLPMSSVSRHIMWCYTAPLLCYRLAWLMLCVAVSLLGFVRLWQGNGGSTKQVNGGGTPKAVKIAGGCTAFFFFTMVLIYHPAGPFTYDDGPV